MRPREMERSVIARPVPTRTRRKFFCVVLPFCPLLPPLCFCVLKKSRYIYKVLKQVHPDTGISRKAMVIMDNFIHDVFGRLATEAGRLARYNSTSFLCCVFLFLPFLCCLFVFVLPFCLSFLLTQPLKTPCRKIHHFVARSPDRRAPRSSRRIGQARCFRRNQSRHQVQR